MLDFLSKYSEKLVNNLTGKLAQVHLKKPPTTRLNAYKNLEKNILLFCYASNLSKSTQ